MDDHDDSSISSLPKSLRPHLFHHPRTDPDLPPPPQPPPQPSVAPYHHRGYPAPEPLFPPAPSRNRAPVYTFPPLSGPRNYDPPRAGWSEGEAGPSSLLHHTRHRRSDSLSPRLAPHYDAFGRANSNYEHESPFVDHVRRDADREPYLLLTGPPLQQQSSYHHLPNTHHQSLPSYHGPDQLVPSSDDVNFSFRHDPYPPPYTSVISNLSLSTPPQQTHFTSPGSAEDTYSYRSDSYTDSFGTRGEETLPPEPEPPSSNKRKRAELVEDKQSTPKKTAVACNFCRGRKLRCDGERPKCSHCETRDITCEYVAVPRRRGPGKKNPKGSRTKKAGASRLVPSSTAVSSNNATAADRPPSAVLPTYELAAQAPEMRPYTHVMSLDTLDIFSFQPPAPAPKYPSHQQQLQQAQQQHHEYYYSRTRSPRRRETSSEDQSGGEM